jgi:proline-specific peptidase
METGYIYSNGVRLYYEMIGQGEPLLLLNGGPGFPHDYLLELRALAPYATLIFYDQRGTGKSDRVDPQGYTIDANVEDVENLRDALQLGPCGVLGHSWGGMLAQAYVLKYPQHVSRLILADTFSSIADCNAALARMRAAMPPETQAIYDRYEREGLYTAGDTYPVEYQAALDRAYEPVFISVPPPDYLQDTFAKIAYDVYRTMWGEESEFRVTGTLAAFDVADRLGEIRVPTLVIAGASDMPTVAMAAATARAIPHARLEIFAHSRHFPFIEEPVKFLQVVRRFLEETGPAEV